MQHTVTFKNPGELDIRFVQMFGVSAKETDNPIGFFGTGLKYAIAIMLRTGGEITLWSGLKKYVFTVKQQTLRDTAFGVVHMNRKPMPFTTELGKTWAVWQAYRELYCNTIDEAGDVHSGSQLPQAGFTAVVVTHDEPFNRDTFMLPEMHTGPCATIDGVVVYDVPSQYLFYRKVRVYDFGEKLPVTFNITEPVLLTEDRTLKVLPSVLGTIRNCMIQLTDASLIRKLVTCPEGGPITTIGFDTFYRTPSQTWLNTVKDLLPSSTLLPAARACYHRYVKTPLVEAVLHTTDVLRMTQALAFCEKAGYPVAKYPIKVAGNLGENVWGKADDGQIFINTSVFRKGSKILVGTLIEEYMHLETGYYYLTRDFQNHIVDELVTMAERVVGEPL